MSSSARLANTVAGVEEVSGREVGGDHDLSEIPVPWEQAAPVIVNRILPIEGVQEARTLVAILFPGPDEEDRDRFSALSRRISIGRPVRRRLRRARRRTAGAPR